MVNHGNSAIFFSERGETPGVPTKLSEIRIVASGAPFAKPDIGGGMGTVYNEGQRLPHFF